MVKKMGINDMFGYYVSSSKVIILISICVFIYHYYRILLYITYHFYLLMYFILSLDFIQNYVMVIFFLCFLRYLKKRGKYLKEFEKP